MTEMYGAANQLQCIEIKDKKDKTCEERHVEGYNKKILKYSKKS